MVTRYFGLTKGSLLKNDSGPTLDSDEVKLIHIVDTSRPVLMLYLLSLLCMKFTDTFVACTMTATIFQLSI